MKYILIFISYIPYITNCISISTAACEVSETTNKNHDPRLISPWVASIFKINKNGNWDYHCGGTLTSGFTVITAASCVTQLNDTLSFSRLHIRYTDLRIVVGLLTNNYYDRDEYTQESQVGMIREHKPPQAKNNIGYVQTYSRPTNLAGIRLKTEFNFTCYVKSVNLVEVPNSIEEIITLRSGEIGTVAGFNINLYDQNKNTTTTTTKYLQNYKFIIQDTIDCVRGYKSGYFNVVCGYLFGNPRPSLPCFMEGAGLIVKTDGIKTGVGTLYLMAIYTTNSATTNNDYPYPIGHINSSTKCTNHDIGFFTKHGEYYRWAISHVYCSTDLLQCQSDNCRPIKELCDGIAQCKDQTDESPEVCLNQKDCDLGTQFRCKYGACIDNLKVCDGNMDCADNSDEEDLKLCREADARRNITCPPIPNGKGTETKCYLPKYLGSSEFPCNTPVPVGTEAVQFCGRYYKIVEGSGLNSITCKRNGNWSDINLITCKPSCGISEPPKIRFIVGGENVTSRGEWPWNTAIYRIQNRKEHFICGGTLISSKVILTAAHCVTSRIGETLLHNDHKIVLGKLFSSYEEKETDYSQEIPIEKFIVNEYYSAISLDSDIALIILKSPVQITDTVRPACFTQHPTIINELFKNANPTNGTKYGTTVGFGLDETKQLSISLKKLNIPVIPKEKCEESLKPYLHEGIRYTWLCGGYTNGSSICNGDSGGGFVFPYDTYSGRKYYVQGIASYGFKSDNLKEDPCRKDTYKFFTHVSLYVPWIQNIIDKMEPDYLI